MAKKILIIDDLPRMRQEMRKILNPMTSAVAALEALEKPNEASIDDRHRIDEAGQGTAGVSLVRSALERGEGYDVILVDLKMPPGIDGIETIRRIRSLDSLVSIVLVTADPESAIPMDSLKDANCGVMPPVFYKPLMATLRELVNDLPVMSARAAA